MTSRYSSELKNASTAKPGGTVRYRVRLTENEQPKRPARTRVRLSEPHKPKRRNGRRNFGAPLTPQQIQTAQKYPEHAYLTTMQAAWYLGLSPKTLQNWRVKGFGPECKRHGPRARRYRFADLQLWANNEAGTNLRQSA